MPESSPSARRRQQQQLWGALGIAAVVLVIGGVLAVRQLAGERRIGLDPMTQCPVKGGPAAFEIILIDASEGFDEPQRIFLSKYFAALEPGIADHTKVAVYVLDGQAQSGLPNAVFTKCKPPSGKDASEWTENPEKLRKVWQASFAEPLNAALGRSLANPGSNESPIMGLLQKAALEVFPASPGAVPRKIILVSDLVEHTRRYSQYGAKPPVFDAFRKQPAAGQVHVDLAGAEVEVLYVTRPGQERVQGTAHLAFWKDYFVWLGIGASKLQIIPVPG